MGGGGHGGYCGPLGHYKRQIEEGLLLGQRRALHGHSAAVVLLTCRYTADTCRPLRTRPMRDVCCVASWHSTATKCRQAGGGHGAGAHLWIWGGGGTRGLGGGGGLQGDPTAPALRESGHRRPAADQCCPCPSAAPPTGGGGAQAGHQSAPHMHVLVCICSNVEAVPQDHWYDTDVRPYTCLHLMAFVLSTPQCLYATRQERAP